MSVLKKLWKFLLFILPNVQSRLHHLREVLDIVDEGIELMEKRMVTPLDTQRVALKKLKDSI